MNISKPEIKKKDEHFYYSVKVKQNESVRTLWYSIDKTNNNMVSSTSDAYLTGLLLFAMEQNEDIYIDGKISKKLYKNLNNVYQKIIKIIIPSLNRISIFPSELYSSNNKASGIATGFSGGIDSFTVLADSFFKEKNPDFKITHLLFSNVGSHGHDLKGFELYKKRYKKILDTENKIGLPFLSINSNLDSFYESFPFEQIHTICNVSAAHFLQGGIGEFLYASAYSYPDVFIGKTQKIAHSDLITLPLLSTEVLDASSVGSEYTRVEKTLNVAKLPITYNSLNVCVNSDNESEFTNCGHCFKCLRTLLTLEIAGYLELYSSSFDLQNYWAKRDEYFAQVLASNLPLEKEISIFIKQKKFKIPIKIKIRSYYFLFENKGKNLFTYFRTKLKSISHYNH